MQVKRSSSDIEVQIGCNATTAKQKQQGWSNHMQAEQKKKLVDAVFREERTEKKINDHTIKKVLLPHGKEKKNKGVQRISMRHQSIRDTLEISRRG
jgi:U3 small nucleolar RNA-associated protein 14